MTDIAGIEAVLGHEFGSPELVTMALTHRSYAAEHNLDWSYERLEFLGDAVLQLTVTRYLYDTYGDMSEGEMAKVRASVVNQKTLATIARDLGIGDYVLLGQGEETSGGNDKDSILADIVESILGAVYLDGGYHRAEEIILRRWIPQIAERASAPGRRDYKTRLQEALAQRGLQPSYVVAESGPDHAKIFTAELWVDGSLVATGAGSSKKRAEQDAAENASEILAEV